MHHPLEAQRRQTDQQRRRGRNSWRRDRTVEASVKVAELKGKGGGVNVSPLSSDRCHGQLDAADREAFGENLQLDQLCIKGARIPFGSMSDGADRRLPMPCSCIADRPSIRRVEHLP